MRKELDSLTQPLINIFNQIEVELLCDIAERFNTYSTVGGSLEWQIKKLQELGVLNADALKVIAGMSNKTQAEMLQMLEAAGISNIDMSTAEKAFNAGAIKINPNDLLESPVMSSIINDSYRQLDKTFKLINTQAIESTKQAYMDIINRTYIEVSSGTLDYQTSIRRGLQRMAAKGITGATYARGGTVVQYSIEGTVRRDTLTAVNQLANKTAYTACKELGCEYVEISKHLGARVNLHNPIANHSGWQGKVFKIDGFTNEYGNLKNNTGYPDDIQGLGGVNCRHRIFPFYPGISTPNPIEYSEEENKRVYDLSQQQRAYERDIRKIKRQIAVADVSNDTQSLGGLNKRLNNKLNAIDKFCKANNLKRDYARENIYL